jgi:hypothetical protein
VEEIVRQNLKYAIATALIFIAVGLTSAQAASPFKKISGGRFLHVPSEVSFPAKVGLFNRANTRLYDSTGRDISVRYILDAFILGDVYVYPSGGPRGDLNQEFATQQNAIRHLYKNVKLLSQTSARVKQSGRNISGRKATYQLVRGLFSEPPHNCGSELVVFQDGPWFVAYRFSYPRERSAIASKHVADFLDRWQWRER